jgi:hypothetical protein
MLLPARHTPPIALDAISARLLRSPFFRPVTAGLAGPTGWERGDRLENECPPVKGLFNYS